jgi:hypothetical protein
LISAALCISAPAPAPIRLQGPPPCASSSRNISDNGSRAPAMVTPNQSSSACLAQTNARGDGVPEAAAHSAICPVRPTEAGFGSRSAITTMIPFLRFRFPRQAADIPV